MEGLRKCMFDSWPSYWSTWEPVQVSSFLFSTSKANISVFVLPISQVAEKLG